MRIFLQLIRRDLVVFRKLYIGKLIDSLIMFAAFTVVMGYFLPLMGMASNYGIFAMVGSIASFGIFEILGLSGLLITDMNGDRTISYLLLLPLRSAWIFCYFAVSWAIQSSLIALPLYFVGKLLLWDQFDLSNITWFRLIVAFITTNLFIGFFALWITGALNKIRDLGRIYFRCINPLFLLGCFFFSWHVAYKLSPSIAYIILFDPLTYIMESMRSAIIGSKDFIPFWWSVLALWGFIILCGWHGMRRLKKHLDYV